MSAKRPEAPSGASSASRPDRTGAPVLKVTGMTKRFGDLVANRDVTLDVFAGEVHALLGENGAGKSTLMNVIYGLLRPDEGTMQFGGEPYHPRSARDAMAAGVGMVHQHFMLIPALRVVENIVLGREPSRGPWSDFRRAADEIAALGERYHLPVDPWARVRDLPVGLQQRVEILKAFYRKARLLILDEPTGMLTVQEADDLFEVVDRLRAEGLSILFISHKLEEVRRISQRVTVMRQGRTVDTFDTEGSTAQGLANAMVGRDVVLRVERPPQQAGEAVLEVEHLSVHGAGGRRMLSDFTLTVHAGEIVGIAGVDGNGQEELASALAGLRPVREGRVRLEGRDITHASVRGRVEAGLAYVPADRQAEGLVLQLSVAENLALHNYWRPPQARGIFLRSRSLLRGAAKTLEAYDVRPRQPDLPAGHLSGGNQQKVILAREVQADPKVLVAAQPTRGLDVGAIEAIQRRLISLRQHGKGILLISLELEEILALSDRIGVLYEGRLVALLSAAEATRERLGFLVAGGTEESAPGAV